MNEKKELLDHRQNLSLDKKIDLTIMRLVEFYHITKGKCYLGLSGGKDSLVLAHIIKTKLPRYTIPFVFSNTLNEDPSIVRKAREWLDVEVKPKMTAFQIWKDKGIPFPTKQQAHFLHQAKTGKSEKHTKRLLTGIMPNGEKTQFKISNKWKFLLDTDLHFNDVCCDILKKRPLKKYEKETGNRPIMGVMATESNQRMFRYLKTGCIDRTEGREVCKPIAFWTEQDILMYITHYDLKIADVYGDVVCNDGIYETTGANRTGCQVCLFGVHLEPSPNRLEQMRINNPRLHNHIINKMGLHEVLDKAKIKY